MGWIKASAMLAFGLVLANGCVGDSGASGGGLSLPEDIGEACSDLGSALCDRGIECGLIGVADRLSCENAAFRACCADDGVCGADIDDGITSSEWNRCIDGFASESCQDIDNGNLPSECIGI